MVLALTLSAELNGVTNLRPLDTAEDPYNYTFKVQCTSCRETHPNWISFNRFEQHEQQGSRGDANFVWRCQNCKRQHSANIVEAPSAYEAESAPKEMNILQLDCRGLEFVEFKADGEWLCEGVESGTKFTAVDLSESEWFEYDEKAGEEVSITGVKWDIQRA
ncbi:uncharacterized protein PV09_02300 [Verruconis gallopava]|uniref:DUF866 domain-containing protein n=1 Tax=Verruconis gallopava TaxID=253628 RepID=A0A0D1XUY9_9PEZI|nr:uncharacterized protein PV09_02300 [Verruconis gallopava]KIW06581.1 hypothetical protein PV09_02300 [Verruconis gallopava]